MNKSPNHIKKIFMWCAIAFFLMFCNIQKVFAQYEIYKAKTINNENIIENEPEVYIPTYNDPDLAAFSEDTDDKNILGFIDKKIKGFKDKRSIKNRKKISKGNNNTLEDESPKIENENPIQGRDIVDIAKSYQEENVNDKNKFEISAHKISMNELENYVYAKGNVEINAVVQKIKLRADEAILDRKNQTIKLQNNVKVIKNGVEMNGEYMLIDLNEENILMDNPTCNAYSFLIKSQEGYLIGNDLQLLNGTVTTSRPAHYALETNSYQRYENPALDYIKDENVDRTQLVSTIKQSYQIKTKEILLTSYKDHDVLQLKNADIYYNKHKIIPNQSLEIITDKQRTVTEINGVEAGTLRDFGTFIGYGWVFRLPQGQALKLMPALTYGDSNFGVGIVGRHSSRNSRIEAGISTSTTRPVVKGKYRLGKDLEVAYGRHAYISEGFMGSRQAGYLAQLEYKKSLINRDLNLRFSNGAYVGFATDYSKKNQEHQFSTMRFRYLADIRKNLFLFENKEQDMSISLNANAQFGATLYGSGDTFGIARIGPYLTTKVRHWDSSIGYLISGVHGDSPFKFDRYRYGKSTVMLNEKFNFGNKLAIGYRANFTPMKDNYNHKFITESRIYACVGPEDLKVVFSYDLIRSTANLDFLFLIGSESSKIDFDRLITKDLDSNQQKRDFYKKSRLMKYKNKENI